MNVGDVYYRKIDNCECEIKGFFYMYEDLTMSLVYKNYKMMMWNALSSSGEKPHVLFHNDTFDTVENLFTNLYMTRVEYDKLQEHIQKMENADGLGSAFQIAKHFPTTEYVEQESYESQHAEAYWNDNDLVPNPGENLKRKLFK